MGFKVRSGDQVKVISGKDNANRAARDSLGKGRR